MKFIVFLALFACSFCRAAEPTRNIIFDTDAGGDCDDVGALFILHGAVERGEAKLLATIGCTSSPAIAPCLDAINTWFGRPEIPVGTLKDPGLLPNPGYTAEIVRRFPHRFRESKDYPDAVTLYRQLLAKQPDGSAIIVAVGPLRNLANLLKSPADEISPMDGKVLIAKKVKRLEVMGGNYPPMSNAKDAEWNFKQDPASAALVCAEWPTEVLFNGEGGSTNSGRRVTYEMPEHNPLTVAYATYPGVGFAGDRLSWDPVSCLVAVRGAAPWYSVVRGGTNVVDPKTGINSWKSGIERGHSYLVLNQKRPKREVETAMEDLMVTGKGRPNKLITNTAYYADAGMCLITSSGALDANSTAMKAFDREGNSVTSWIDRATASWIQCEYADGRKRLVTSYAITCPEKNRLPRTLALSGSNDGGKSWTSIDVRTAPGFKIARRREFTIVSPAKWNILRLNVTPTDEMEGIQISMLELNEVIDCQRNIAVDSIALDRESVTIPTHGRATLNAMVSPLNSFDREVNWASSDPNVAEVRRIGEQTAMLAGKKPGTCTVTAMIGDTKRVCTVTVTPSTRPDGWRYDELNDPPIPGSFADNDGKFVIAGCGHAMTSWWERVRDQSVFINKPIADDIEISARLLSLSRSAGGPNANRPSTSSGLMLRESLSEKCSRYVLLQVETSGTLVCRWRDKSGDQDDNQMKALGKVSLPIHLKLLRSGNETQLFTSVDGRDWGEPRMSRKGSFDRESRVGLFVCSGNSFTSTTAEYDSVRIQNRKP